MKAKLAPWLLEARGLSGATVFKKVNGQIIMASKPSKRTTPYSATELDVQERFLDARDYAQYVKLNPALLALYEQPARDAGKSVYMLCREDWYKPPKVGAPRLERYKGQAGDSIRFKVRNEICVAQVIVTLSDAETGTLIEQGDAAPEVEGTQFWIYSATRTVQSGTIVSIRIEAFDHPGNVGQQSASKAIP